MGFLKRMLREVVMKSNVFMKSNMNRKGGEVKMDSKEVVASMYWKFQLEMWEWAWWMK